MMLLIDDGCPPYQVFNMGMSNFNRILSFFKAEIADGIQIRWCGSPGTPTMTKPYFLFWVRIYSGTETSKAYVQSVGVKESIESRCKQEISRYLELTLVTTKRKSKKLWKLVRFDKYPTRWPDSVVTRIFRHFLSRIQERQEEGKARARRMPQIHENKGGLTIKLFFFF